MGMFARRIADAKPGENRGLFFEPGLYPLVQCKKVKIFPSAKPGREGTDMMAIEFDILESKVEARPAGMQNVSQVLNGAHTGSAQDGINFLVSALPEIDPKEWAWDETKKDEEQGVSLVASPLQPARGRLVMLECFHKKSNRSGNIFTVHRYTAVKPEVQARAAELRAKAGLPPLGI